MLKYDNHFNRTMTKVFDFLLLNVLFLISSLPIFTIGAALTALYGTCLQMVDKNESSVTKLYWQMFKKNFKQSTIIGGLLVGLLAILLVDLKLVVGFGTGYKILGIGICAFLLLWCVYFLYVFPMIATFENTVVEVLKNTFFVAIGYLPYTILIAFLTFGPLLIVLNWVPKVFNFSIYFYLFIGIALTVYINSKIFTLVFTKLLQAKGRLSKQTE
ncbi:MAG TPA: DUF624 domain-containing protein [Candidatus Tetragenococcus pullicola]|nr:DUF624 domain-containing protein [Candidatus Tetragenococcus pullicola]